MGTSPDACVAAAKWEELTNRPKLAETPSVVKKKGLVDVASLLTLACFCRVFPGTYENALPPVWFVPFPDSLDWLPVASCLSSASPQLSRCLLSPTAALSSVTSALLCHLLHLPDVLSSLLHLPATPPSTFFLPPAPPSYSNYERSCSPHTGLPRTENTAKLFSCCVAGLCLLTCCCISSRQSFHLIFHFSWWTTPSRTHFIVRCYPAIRLWSFFNQKTQGKLDHLLFNSPSWNLCGPSHLIDSMTRTCTLTAWSRQTRPSSQQTAARWVWQDVKTMDGGFWFLATVQLYLC